MDGIELTNLRSSPLVKRRRFDCEEGTPPRKLKAVNRHNSPIKVANDEIIHDNGENCDTQNIPAVALRKRSSSVFSKIKRKSLLSLQSPVSKRNATKARRLSAAALSRSSTPKTKQTKEVSFTNHSKKNSEKHSQEENQEDIPVAETSKRESLPKLSRSKSLKEFNNELVKPMPQKSGNMKRMLSFSMRTSQKLYRQGIKLSQSADSAKNDVSESIVEDTLESSHSYFGIDLCSLMSKQREISGLENLKVPYFIHYCISKISSNLETEGLFRISPRLTELEAIQDLIDSTPDMGHSFFTKHQKDETAEPIKVHIYTGILKKFLRDLPTPLLGDRETYKRWIQIAQELNERCVSDLIISVTEILNTLPTEQVSLVMDILQLSALIGEFSTANLMGIDNVSRVIGPNLLWDDTIRDPMTSTEHIFLVNSLTEFLILHVDLLMPDPETESDSDGSEAELVPSLALERGEETESDSDSDDFLLSNE